ncbi:MAG: hypothetical protein WD135_07345 [Ferruginibacter sp.]
MFSSTAYSQQADFIVLKKKNRTVKNFFSGTQIEFVAINGAYRNALITGIKNDSLYLQEFMVYRMPTTLGTYILDTTGSYRYTYHYNQIKSFGIPKKGFNVSGSGAALMGGGALLVLASGVSYLINKDQFRPELVGAAVILGGIGYLLNKSAANRMVIGKKYTLEYISLQ